MQKDVIGTLMDEEIERSWEEVKNLQPGTKEREDAVDELKKLMDMRAQSKKTKSESLDKYVGWGLKAAEIVVPLCAYGVWITAGFQLESKGEALCSPVFRSLWNRFSPTKL